MNNVSDQMMFFNRVNSFVDSLDEKQAEEFSEIVAKKKDMEEEEAKHKAVDMEHEEKNPLGDMVEEDPKDKLHDQDEEKDKKVRLNRLRKDLEELYSSDKNKKSGDQDEEELKEDMDEDPDKEHDSKEVKLNPRATKAGPGKRDTLQDSLRALGVGLHNDLGPNSRSQSVSNADSYMTKQSNLWAVDSLEEYTKKARATLTKAGN